MGGDKSLFPTTTPLEIGGAFKRSVPNQSLNVQTLRKRYPPAIAGTIETSAPSGMRVARLSRNLMSSPSM